MNKDKRVRDLREQFVNTLIELDDIAPLRFLDLDNSKMLNLRNVVYSSEEDGTFVELTAMTDSLPPHKDVPLRDDLGEPIPYIPIETIDDVTMDILCALVRTSTPQSIAKNLHEATIHELCCKLTGSAVGSIYDMVWAIRRYLKVEDTE